MTIRKMTFAVALTLLATSTYSPADVPMLLNYQGNLTAPDGTPKDGTFSMQFAVYDAETGGNQLPSGTPWVETQSVTVTNGAFNVLLGSVTALPTNLFDGGPSDSAGPLRFLQVTVNGEPLMPRRRVASSAYAIKPGAFFSGCTLRQVSCSSSECSIFCNDGESLLFGGCGVTSSIRESSFNLPNQWRCTATGGSPVNFVQAMCCQ